MDAGSTDKRGALRVPCDFPVRVYGQLREVPGRLVNISRTGLRISLPLSRILTSSALDFGALAHAVGQMLGSSFMADLHYEMLGQLIRKKLHLVRVGDVDPETDLLEIACTFDDPLRDEETVMLGIGLPPIGETRVTAYKNVPAPRRRGDPEDATPPQPRPAAYEGILHPSEGYLTEPLVGATEGVIDGEALVLIPAARILALPDATGTDPLSLLRLWYGPGPRMEILDGLHMVWSGPVQLEELEMPSAAGGDAVLLCRTT